MHFSERRPAPKFKEDPALPISGNLSIHEPESGTYSMYSQLLAPSSWFPILSTNARFQLRLPASPALQLSSSPVPSLPVPTRDSTCRLPASNSATSSRFPNQRQKSNPKLTPKSPQRVEIEPKMTPRETPKLPRVPPGSAPGRRGGPESPPGEQT